MDLVADESVDGQVIAALRTAGHQVVSIGEEFHGIKDSEVLRFAASRRELLLTEDKDFGELVHLRRQAHAGVILLRINEMATPDKIARVLMVLSHHGNDLGNSFTTVTKDKIRFRKS